MKNKWNVSGFNLKSFRKNIFLSFVTLLLITVLFSSPFLSNTWGQATYTITYRYDPGITNIVSNPTSYDGSVDVHIANAYDPCYEFLGWSVTYFQNYTQVYDQLNFVIPAGTKGNIELYAVFNSQPLGYPITYELAGGNNNPLNKERYFGDNEYFPIVIYAPSRAGYNFLGWTATYTDGTPAVTIPQTSFSIQDGTTGAIALTAHWSDPIIYNIAYDLDGGSHSGPSTYTVVQLPLNVGAPSKSGYNFLGWTAICANTSSINLSGNLIPAGTTNDITLQAKWTVSNNAAYTVIHYDADSTTVLETEFLTGTIGSPAVAGIKAFTGYTFAASDTRNALFGTILSDGSLVLEVYYTPHIIDIRYVLIYNGNGYTSGSVPADSNSPYLEGSRVTVLDQGNMNRNNFAFLGWALSPTASTATFTAGSTFIINNNTVLYAVWSENTYTVTYQPGTHGTFTAQITNGLRYGDQTPSAPTVTSTAGWEFTNWSPNPSTTVTGNATYVAQWTQQNTSPSPSPSATTTPSPSSPPSATTTPSPSATTTPFPSATPSGGHRLEEFSGTDAWSLINLIISTIGVILVVIAFLYMFLLKRKQDGQKNVRIKQNKLPGLMGILISAALAAVGIVVFLVTEDLSLPYGWIMNKWTIVNTIILVLECITILLCLKTAKTRKINKYIPKIFYNYTK